MIITISENCHEDLNEINTSKSFRTVSGAWYVLDKFSLLLLFIASVGRVNRVTYVMSDGRVLVFAPPQTRR